MSGHTAAGASTESILSPDVLGLTKSSRRIEAAARKDELAMEPGRGILQRVDFYHASHFSAIFSGDSCRIDAHRLHIICFDLRAKAGRAMVREGNAIHNELRLIFRAARMQDGIAFIQPARLRIDEILQRAPRNRANAV